MIEPLKSLRDKINKRFEADADEKIKKAYKATKSKVVKVEIIKKQKYGKKKNK